ncbi:MAG: trypsin-like peptidase domain-containing protein [Oscillospiraceae bacterium]|nr:trypsin-like peptidase domain-containing protein [Oscillospiraceae bacterium]
MDHNDEQQVLQPEDNAPITESAPAEGVYRNAGAGRKESPFADSPYETSFQPRQEPAAEASTPVPKKGTRSGLGRKALAAVLALAVIAGSCGITASILNRRWETVVSGMTEDFHTQLDQMENRLQSQIAAQGIGGVSVSGTGTTDGLTVSQVYARNVNSVVAISNYQNLSDRYGSSSQLAGTGSGFIISEDGYVITNHHVVKDADSLQITTHLGEEYAATLVGSDEINDVALLKVEVTGLDPVEIGSSDALLVGDMVVAIGNPLGELTSTSTVGYVSGKDRSVSTDGTIINMLQTDAAINSGNSGGPLFNMKGQVIGITTAKYSGSTGSGASIEGIGFAIPIDDVLGMIEDFKAYGYLRNQAYLGVTVMNLDASTARLYSLPMGSYVQTVVEGGCAEAAGIRPQDIIIAVGEYPVDSNSTLTSSLRRFSAGDTTTITVYRGGAEVELTITFDERPQDVGVGSNEELEPGEMPETGSYDEWYEYFKRYFGKSGN